MQLSCRHLINPYDPTCTFDHTLQFAVVSGPHVPKIQLDQKKEHFAGQIYKTVEECDYLF